MPHRNPAHPFTLLTGVFSGLSSKVCCGLRILQSDRAESHDVERVADRDHAGLTVQAESAEDSGGYRKGSMEWALGEKQSQEKT